MPINNITQTISTLPPAGRRGVDVQTQFVIKQEDFQDHLQGTTVTELNTLKDQLNSRIGEINSTATTMNGYASTASAGASTATTKAGEASTSAGEALAYRNQAETFKNNASASATKASQWSDNNYNVEVEAGKYSAKHWSTVAQNATANKIDKVTSTDNAIVRFNGTTGEVQNSAITIDDNGYISAIATTDGEHVFKPNTTSEFVRLSATASDYSSLPSWTETCITQYGSTATGNFIGSIPNANLGALWAQNISNMLIGTNSGSPIIFANGSTEKMRIDTAGNVGIGTGNPANSKFNKTFTTQVTGASSVAITAGDYSALVGSTVTVVESFGNRNDGNGSFGGRFGASYRRSDGLTIPAGNTIGYYAFGGQWGTDVGYVPSKHLYTASICGVSEGAFTSSTAMATGISFRTGSTGESLGNVNTTYGTEKMRIDSSGNVLLTSSTGGLGYGIGAGGIVTQLTSKSTSVTLNKPTGVITMNNAALAAGAIVTFQLNNSLLTSSDNLYVCQHWGNENYRIQTQDVNSGYAKIQVENRSTSSQLETIVIRFDIIKGAHS